MPRHPSETQIVELARDQHPRVRAQLEASGAEVVITLGNAAARVLTALGGQSGGALVRETYQEVRSVSIGGRALEWHALVHPAVRPPWTEVHRAWRENRR